MYTNSGWIISKITVCGRHFNIYIYIYSEYKQVSVVDMNRCVHYSGWDINRKMIVCGHDIYRYIYIYIYIYSEYELISVVYMNNCL